MLRGMLRDLEIGTVLDVGANTGQFAARLRAIGFTGRIISFEPVARNFAAMSGRMAGDPLWHGMHMALGDADGEAVINVEPAMTVMTSLLTQIEAPSGMETETVAVRRLDGVLPDLMRGRDGQRILLKMDTQGYDLKCFSGAGGCLGQVEALFSELSVKPIYHGSPHYLESLAVYEAAGFVLVNLSVESRSMGAVQEMNCLMRRARDPRPSRESAAPHAQTEALS